MQQPLLPRPSGPNDAMYKNRPNGAPTPYQRPPNMAGMISPGPGQSTVMSPRTQQLQRPPAPGFRPPFPQAMPPNAPPNAGASPQQRPLAGRPPPPHPGGAPAPMRPTAPPTVPGAQLHSAPSPGYSLSSGMENLSLQGPPQQQNPGKTEQKPGRSRRVYAPLNDQQPQGPPGPHLPPANQQPQGPPNPRLPPASQQPATPALTSGPMNRPKPKIDPNQIPSPVQAQLADAETYHREIFGTCSLAQLPLTTTNFRAIDQGNCNPRFMRATLRTLPKTHDLVRDTHLPFGLVVQPLAALHPEDEPVPLARSTGLDGPVRCNRCKGYINPACRFTDGGRKFVCNLCGFENNVPEHYFSYLDMSGQRLDIHERPELQKGTVEFEVPEIYWTRKPNPLRVLFAVDVSGSSVQSGMLESFCTALQSTLFTEAAFPKGIRVAIMTFDKTVHFYNLSAAVKQAQMMVVSDINDMFLPLAEDSFFVDPHESRSVIENLLSSLPRMFAENRTPTSVFGSAIKGGLLSLKATGGKIHVFQTQLPAAGPGALKPRDNPQLYGTEKERQLFAPQDTLYNTMGKECVNQGVCVDLWLFPVNTYVDASTLGVLPALTGGDTHYYPNYDKQKHERAFINALTNCLCREQGYNVALRIRCSNGLAVDDRFGNFFMNNSTDLEFGGIDSEKSVAFTLKHDGKLDDSEAYIQCALLYTTVTGQRRVRIHNLQLPVSSDISTLFRQADLETSINLVSKRIVSQSAQKTSQELSTQLDGECTHILAAYRKHCASSASAGQLILPESFKVLPLYVLALKKCSALRRDSSINIDTRVHNMRKLKSAGIATTIRWLYPQMIPIHAHLACDSDIVPLERLSYERLDSAGIYFVDGPDVQYLWVGQNTSSETLQSIFGVMDVHQIDPNMTEIPVLDNPLSQRLQSVITRYPVRPLKVLRQGYDVEHEFAMALVEDETYGQMSYVDYLCVIHKNIQDELERAKHEDFISNASYWAYRY